MKAETLSAVLAAKKDGRAAVLATRLADGAEQLIDVANAPEGPLGDAVRKAATSDVSQPIELDGETWFLNVFNPPIALVIVGAVHIAQPLSRMAAALGWKVSVIDPRTAFASEARFPGVELFTDWPDEAMDRIVPNARTAVVTLTHDPKLDDPALQSALRSKAFYIGALGSRKTHGSRLARLSEAGFSEAETAKIRGPVGLKINAKSPAEIAVSVLGQIIETLRAEAR